MKNGNTTGTGGGIGFCGALTVLFVALKLLGKIDWPWGWVLAPAWIGAIIVILLIAGIVVLTKHFHKF